jgi:hypothetical protein
LNDVRSLNYASFIEWLNPKYRLSRQPVIVKISYTMNLTFRVVLDF